MSRANQVGYVASNQIMSCNKLKYQVSQQFLSRDITFMSRWRSRYTMTAKQEDTATDVFLVLLPVKLQTEVQM